MNITQSLNWRYATKGFDVTKKISAADFATLSEALRLAPSSYGLQPWKFVVVENPEVRATLRGHAWDQPQITDASHLVVIAVPKMITVADVDAFIAATAATRGMEVEQLAGYADMIKGSIAGKSEADFINWNARQAYIALGFLLETAALMEIDATPMEGFSNADFDNVLGLGEMGHTSVVVCALGYRSAEDKYADAAKVRKTAEEVFVHVA